MTRRNAYIAVAIVCVVATAVVGIYLFWHGQEAAAAAAGAAGAMALQRAAVAAAADSRRRAIDLAVSAENEASVARDLARDAENQLLDDIRRLDGKSKADVVNRITE
jgi:flagellar basal body-associated protein FliL